LKSSERREETRKRETASTPCCSQQSVSLGDSDKDSDIEEQDADHSDYEVEIPVCYKK